MPDMAAIVKGLIDLRVSTGMSQRDLAAKLDVSHTTIQMIEAGKRGIWLEDMILWIKKCDADPIVWLSQLLEEEGRETLERDQELTRLFNRALRQSDRRDVIEALFTNWFKDEQERGPPKAAKRQRRR